LEPKDKERESFGSSRFTPTNKGELLVEVLNKLSSFPPLSQQILNFSSDKPSNLKSPLRIDKNADIFAKLRHVHNFYTTNKCLGLGNILNMTLKILLVEDDHSYRRQWVEQLTLQGEVEVVFASNVEDALYYLNSQNPPDVAIVDINLNGFLSGIDFLKILREKKNDIPVIILTSTLDMNQDLQCNEIDPSVPFLHKSLYTPSKPQMLLNRIKQLLKLKDKTNKGTYQLEGHTLKLNHDRKIVRLNNNVIRLTPSEFSIFKALLTNYNIEIVITPTSELLKLFNKTEHDKGSLEAHITNLRKKLQSSGVEIFITNHSGGYYLHV